MVVNGSSQFVGSSESDLESALDKSLNTKPTAAEILFKTDFSILQFEAAKLYFYFFTLGNN